MESLSERDLETMAARLYEVIHESLYVEPWEFVADHRREKYRRAVRRLEELRRTLVARRADDAAGDWAR